MFFNESVISLRTLPLPLEVPKRSRSTVYGNHIAMLMPYRPYQPHLRKQRMNGKIFQDFHLQNYINNPTLQNNAEIYLYKLVNKIKLNNLY